MSVADTLSDNDIAVRDALPDDVEAISSLYAWHVLNGRASFEETPPLFRPCRLSGPFHVAPLHLVVEIAAVLNFSIPDHMGQPPLSMLLLRLHIAVAG